MTDLFVTARFFPLYDTNVIFGMSDISRYLALP